MGPGRRSRQSMMWMRYNAVWQTDYRRAASTARDHAQQDVHDGGEVKK